MTTDTLEAPTTAVAVIQTGIVEFNATEQALAELQHRLKDIAYPALNTGAGMQAAIDDRATVRNLRIGVEKMAEDLNKKDRADTKTRCEQRDAGALKLATALNALHDPIDQQIKAEEKRKADAKAEKDRKEAERRKKHTDRIAALAGMVERAAGKTAADLATAIETLENTYSTHPDVFEEFSQEAGETKVRVIAALKALQVKTAAQEAQAAENERIRIANEAEQNRLALLGRIASQVTECFGQSAAVIETRIGLMRRTRYAEGTPAEVQAAHDQAVKQMEQLLDAAKTREAARQSNGAAQAPRSESERGGSGSVEPSGSAAANPIATPEAAPPITPVALEQQSAHSTTLRMGDFPPPSVRGTGGPITMVDTSAVECIDLLTLLRDLHSLAAHANEAFVKTKFPTQPKPSPEWWGRLRAGIEAVQPRLDRAIQSLEEAQRA